MSMTKQTSYCGNGDGEEVQPTTNAVDRTRPKSGDIAKDILEKVFMTDNKELFYGKVTTWSPQKNFYLKNEIICEITCFAPPRPYTECIRADCDLRIVKWIAEEDQKLSSGDKLFVYTDDLASSSYSTDTTNARSVPQASQHESFDFSYKTVNDIAYCIGKSQEEITRVCQQLGCSEPFTLAYADRIADKLVGYPSIKRAWESRQRSIGAPQPGNKEAAIVNQISEPLEGLDDFIVVVRDSYAFQIRDILERIVNTERERIESERGLWKLGAGIAALALGISVDGFDTGDLFAGWTFSNIGGAAHQFASKKQLEFLKKLHSEWLVLDKSPMDLRRRLGEPQGRFIGISQFNRLDMFNIHQCSSRGYHLVELDLAGNIAKGFKNPQSLEVLQRSYDQEDIGTLSNQLYPSTIAPLKICHKITPNEARKKDPYFNQLSKAGAPFRIVYENNTEGIMYKIQIPQHSDY